MNFIIENIIVNCQRLIDCYDGIFNYICTASSTGDYHSIKKALHSLVYTGGWFFYSRQTDGGYVPRGQVCAHARPYSYFYCHGADLCRLLVRNIRLRKPSVAFFYFKSSRDAFGRNPGKTIPRYGCSMLFGCSFLWFRVSEGGHRYAHKTPVFSTRQDKNSTLENSHNSMQCPKPDNMRPKKAILPFFWESLERNNGLTLGRLVSIVQVNAGLWHLGFLREKGL